MIILTIALKKACRTNDSLRSELCEQRSVTALITDVRTENARAMVTKRASSYAVFLSDSVFPTSGCMILIKEFRFDGDEDYARLLAEELCDKLNETPYQPGI